MNGPHFTMAVVARPRLIPLFVLKSPLCRGAKRPRSRVAEPWVADSAQPFLFWGARVESDPCSRLMTFGDLFRNNLVMGVNGDGLFAWVRVDALLCCFTDDDLLIKLGRI